MDGGERLIVKGAVFRTGDFKMMPDVAFHACAIDKVAANYKSR